jgi:hypothetical protein
MEAAKSAGPKMIVSSRGEAAQISSTLPVDKSLGLYRERSGKRRHRKRKTALAGSFAIRRFVVNRPGVWQGNCFMGKVSVRYTNVQIVH